MYLNYAQDELQIIHFSANCYEFLVQKDIHKFQTSYF